MVCSPTQSMTFALVSTSRARASDIIASRRAGRSGGPLCRVVELNGHGPRHPVADVDAHVQYACDFVVGNLAQQVEECTGVKRFLLMLHDSPQAMLTELASTRLWRASTEVLSIAFPD